MCTKSKTTFGCGHAVKVTNECGVPGCTEVEKYKMPDKDCDCAICKSEGANITRGRDGRGRHALEIRTRESRQSSYDSIPPSSPHLTISPWLPADPLDSKEQKWDKPTRRQADDAWVIEHERRMSDLDEKSSRISMSPPRGSPRMSRTASPTSSYELIVEADYVEEPEEILPTRSKAIKMLPYEISEGPARSHSRCRGRKLSHDSQHSSPYLKEVHVTPRRQTRVVYPVSEHETYESRQLMPIPRRHGSKTEPYLRHPQSCSFNSLLWGSPMMGPHWQGYPYTDWSYRTPGGEAIRHVCTRHTSMYETGKVIVNRARLQHVRRIWVALGAVIGRSIAKT